jgi:hypothetical protein
MSIGSGLRQSISRRVICCEYGYELMIIQLIIPLVSCHQAFHIGSLAPPMLCALAGTFITHLQLGHPSSPLYTPSSFVEQLQMKII